MNKRTAAALLAVSAVLLPASGLRAMPIHAPDAAPASGVPSGPKRPGLIPSASAGQPAAGSLAGGPQRPNPSLAAQTLTSEGQSVQR